MARTRRKKKRTQNDLQTPGPAPPAGKTVPKSFVMARGKLSPLLRHLRHDLRKLMMPNTALNLKESKKNSMKDFVHVAGPLGVTHFLIFSCTKEAPYLRLARTPHGPTLTFKIHAYSLAADVANAQIRPRAPPSVFKTTPLVVLNGFKTAQEHLKLVTIMFQNLFPPIDIQTVKLSNCQRVLLLNYDEKTKHIEFRHFTISAQPVGVTRTVRKLVQRKKIPNLCGMNDISEFLTKPGYGSESEAEDEAAKVELSGDYGPGNVASHRSAVKLHEIGPRMTLQLVKVEEGLCSGGVMFHEYVKKTPEEIAALREAVEKREALRKQRKAEQEANVQRKELERKKRKWKAPEENQPEQKQPEDEDTEFEYQAEPVVDNYDDDAEWYRKEVGQEPDEVFLAGAKRRPAGNLARRFAQRGGKESGNGRSRDRGREGGEERGSRRNRDGERREGGKERGMKRSRDGHGGRGRSDKRQRTDRAQDQLRRDKSKQGRP